MPAKDRASGENRTHVTGVQGQCITTVLRRLEPPAGIEPKPPIYEIGVLPLSLWGQKGGHYPRDCPGRSAVVESMRFELITPGLRYRRSPVRATIPKHDFPQLSSFRWR